MEPAVKEPVTAPPSLLAIFNATATKFARLPSCFHDSHAHCPRFPGASGNQSIFRMNRARVGLSFIATLALCTFAQAGDATRRPAVTITGAAASQPIIDWMPPPSGDAWLEVLPDVSDLAPSDLLPQRAPARLEPEVLASTGPYEARRGPFKLGVESVIKPANAPKPSPVPAEPWAPFTAADDSEVKGRLELDQPHWQLYGAGALGVSAGTGPAAVRDTVAVGAYYKLPWLFQGGKIGGQFQVDNLADRKARVEYRHVFGDNEGFLAAERSLPSAGSLDAPALTAPIPNTSLRAGFNRKF